MEDLDRFLPLSLSPRPYVSLFHTLCLLVNKTWDLARSLLERQKINVQILEHARKKFSRCGREWYALPKNRNNHHSHAKRKIIRKKMVAYIELLRAPRSKNSRFFYLFFFFDQQRPTVYHLWASYLIFSEWMRLTYFGAGRTVRCIWFEREIDVHFLEKKSLLATHLFA